MMPLVMAQPGEPLKLVALCGGQHMRRRLADLGLTLDMPLYVVQRDRHGPLIVAVKDTRLAIGCGMALHIMVEPLES